MTEEAAEPATTDQPQKLQRLGFWQNIVASFKHIRKAVDEEGNRIRKTDPITVWLVPAVAIVLVFVAGIAGWPRLFFTMAAYISVIIYIAVRIGIVRALNYRQTNIIWHLLLASFLAGVLFTFAFLEFMRLSGA
jgi:hypothetical protein